MTTSSGGLIPFSLATIQRSRPLRFDFRLPGDKSISHRTAMIAAIGNGISRIGNYSSAVDCQSTLDCLSSLGVTAGRDGNDVVVEGKGFAGFSKPTARLDAGNSGTTIRLLSGILAGLPFETEISGDTSLSSRPMKRIMDPLRLMVAHIEAHHESYTPLRISGGNLRAIDYIPPVASAQVKSCVLLAGLSADGTTNVTERVATRDHTEIMLTHCGATIEVSRSEQGTTISVEGKQSFGPLGNYIVPSDLSSAAFFIAAVLMTPGSEGTLRDVGANPSRTALLNVLRDAGAEIQLAETRTLQGEPVTDIAVRHSTLKGRLEVSGAMVANLIDEVPVLAILGTQIDGSLKVSQAKELRVKECDRIDAIVRNLRAMNVEIEEYEDGFFLEGPQRLMGARVESFDDHRIAMAFAVAGLAAQDETTINGAHAAAVSLPEFFNLLKTSGASVELS